MDRKIIVVSGERGAGKSTYCLEQFEISTRNFERSGGIISPAVYEEGIKTAFYTLDVRTMEKRLCGKRVQTGGTIVCWEMDPDVMAWGNELLRSSCPCSRLFIDELGPLEFFRGGGYRAAFEVLEKGDFGTAYVVIRPECVDAFRQCFPNFELIRIGKHACTTGPMK